MTKLDAEGNKMQDFFDPTKFSYSKIISYITCPKKFYWQYIKGIRSQQKSKALAAGYAVHLALQKFREKNASLEENLKAAKQGLIEAFKSEEADVLSFEKAEDPLRSVERLDEIIENYCRTHENEPSKMIQCEITFELPLSEFDNSVIFNGRIDGIINDHGSPALIEDKTTSMLGENWVKEKSSSFQIIWYLMAAKEMGLFDIEGKTTISKGLINAIYINKLHYAPTSGVACRQPTIKMNSTLVAARKELVTWIGTILHAYNVSKWPCNYEKCTEYGGCEYSLLKGLDENSSAFERIVKENFKIKEKKKEDKDGKQINTL